MGDPVMGMPPVTGLYTTVAALLAYAIRSDCLIVHSWGKSGIGVRRRGVH